MKSKQPIHRRAATVPRTFKLSAVGALLGLCALLTLCGALIGPKKPATSGAPVPLQQLQRATEASNLHPVPTLTSVSLVAESSPTSAPLYTLVPTRDARATSQAQQVSQTAQALTVIQGRHAAATQTSAAVQVASEKVKQATADAKGHKTATAYAVQQAAAQSKTATAYKTNSQPAYSASAQSSDCTSTVRVGAICSDGSHSDATGRGACSHHGGVDHWLYDCP